MKAASSYNGKRFTFCGIREGVQKKRIFLGEIFPKCVYPPTQGFLRDLGKRKVKFGSKKAIFAVILRGLGLVWESATLPTHIWEKSTKKSFLGVSHYVRVFTIAPFSGLPQQQPYTHSAHKQCSFGYWWQRVGFKSLWRKSLGSTKTICRKPLGFNFFWEAMGSQSKSSWRRSLVEIHVRLDSETI